MAYSYRIDRNEDASIELGIPCGKQISCLFGRIEGRQVRRPSILVEVERVRNEVHEAPDRHHDDESDDAPHNELLPFITLLLVRPARDKVIEHAPDEDEERYREQEWDEVDVDEPDDAREVLADSVSPYLPVLGIGGAL
jgi:hypothetical protein